MEKREIDHWWLAVIAGGKGARLFPYSYEGCPKQFCKLDNESTFSQATIKRFLDCGISSEHVVIITTNPGQTKLASEQAVPLGVLPENIVQIDPALGYANAMIEAGSFIYKHDRDAVAVNTPADHFINADLEFHRTVREAVENATSCCPTIICVEVKDITLATGCGHAIFDPAEKSSCKTVLSFIEKPDEEKAAELINSGRSACNTGINVWAVKDLMKAKKGLRRSKKQLSTDALMARFEKLQVAIGKFTWLDCGTLKSLYEISAKDINSGNAHIGEGKVSQTDCQNSLFVTIEGVTLYAVGIKDTAVVVNKIENRYIIAIVRLADSQMVREIAEDYDKNKELLAGDFGIRARNNHVGRTNISSETIVDFVGVERHSVSAIREENGNIAINISNENK